MRQKAPVTVCIARTRCLLRAVLTRGSSSRETSSARLSRSYGEKVLSFSVMLRRETASTVKWWGWE